tara:strand:+ start:8354 stop:13219 length:4866 start_codon:yes stop_codon:yes gene_type:complete
MADKNLIQNVVDTYNERQEAGDEYRQKAKEAGDRIKQTTASKVVRGAISGPIKAINETVETVDDVYDYFAGNPYDNNDLIDLKGIGLEVEGDKEDWTYTVPQSVTQFLLPMGLVGGATRKVITNPWARGAVAGFITDAVVQDPYEENLFNMLDEHPRFASPITELLKAKTEEEIGVAEARLRQATGGTLTGEIATGVVLGVRALKKAPKAVQERILKRLMNDENTRLVYAASDDIDNLGDEIIPDVPKPTGRQKILPGTPHPTDANKVRGYDGRWVTKKHFDQVTESRKGADEIKAQFNEPPKLDLTTDTRGKGEFYHGAADEFELDSSSHYKAPGLYGQGLYTTDDVTTAGKYQKKNRKLVKTDAKQTVYKITEKRPVNFFDLDQPVPQDIVETLEGLQAQSELYDEVIGRTFDEFKIGSYNKSTGKNPSLGQIFDELKAQNSANEFMPAYEIDNIISDVESKLRDQGFGGFIHQGGKKAGKGKRLHQVKIYWDPQDQLDINKVDAGGGGAVPFKNKIQNVLDSGSETDFINSGAVQISSTGEKGVGTIGIFELTELEPKQLKELNLTKSDLSTLTKTKQFNILKTNFDYVYANLPAGEYSIRASSKSREKLFKRILGDRVTFTESGNGIIKKDASNADLFSQGLDNSGSGAAVPPRKPPSGSGADVPPVDPTDPKVQTTFNPKFTGGGDPDVQKLILDTAEENKRLDAAGLWPHKRTFKDMVESANRLLPKEVIEQARLFNARYGRGGEDDLPAILIAMNQQMNKNATALYDLSKAMDMALASGNKEGFAELKEQLIRETKVLDGLITLNKPLKTVPAQTLAANKAGGGIANKVATVEDLASRTPAEKAIDQAVDVRGVVDEGGEEVVEQETIRQIIEAAEKGDKPAMKKLRRITKQLQAASGNPEALRKMAQEGPIIKGLRVSNEIFINSILSGPETHAVNILSTALNTVARPLEQIAGAGSISFRKNMDIGFIKSLISNRSNFTFNPQFDATAAMRGAKELIYLTQSISDSLKMAKAAFRIEDNIINPGAMVQDASRFNVRMDGEGLLPNIINTFGTIQRLPSRFLLAEDEFFKSMNFRAYVKASAWENGVNKGLDGKQLKAYIQDQFDKTIGIVNEGSMKNTKSIEIAELYEKAQQYAAETTFTADLPQGSFGAGLQKFASHPVGRIVFPFVRTPLNIFKAQVRRTPGVNLLLQEYRQALRSSDPSVAARARGEMVVGGAVWSVAGIAAYAINDDFSELALTGGGPSDYDLLNQKKATGWQPYSFRFLLKDENGQVIMGKDGKPRYKYVSFKRLDPWSSFLMMSADAAAITGQLSQQDRDDFGVAAAVALGRNITNKTYLQGVVEISDLLQKPHKLESWLARRAAATVNPFSSLGRSASKALDPTIMDKRVRSGYEGIVVLRKFHNEFAATIPGYGAGMRPIRNFITGSLVEYPPGYGPDIMNIMNPIKETNSVNHAVLTTLVDIGAKIPQPSDNLPFGKKLDGSQELSGIKLDKDQYADYVEEIAFAKINGVPLVRALYNQMQQTEIKALLITARGEDIKTDNQDTAVAAQEAARAKLEIKFKDTISTYKKAGRSLFLQKNPNLALEYTKRKAEIMQIMSESALDSFKKLQGVSN